MGSEPTLTFKRVKIDSLHLDPANARMHPDENLEIVAKNDFDGKIMATPAPAKDDLIFRVDSKLYRVGKTAG